MTHRRRVVPVAVGMVLATHAASTRADDRVSASDEVDLPWLWEDPQLPDGLTAAGPELRGIAAALTPGRAAPRDGFGTGIAALPTPSHAFEVAAFDELTFKPFTARNVDVGRLLARYPTTLPQDLLGGRRVYLHQVGMLARGPLSKSLGFYVDAIDARTSDQPLGAPIADAAWAPRYTVNLRYAPSSRAEATMGVRYDGLFIDRDGLSAWDRPATARQRKSDAILFILGGRLQLGSHDEVSASLDGAIRRDDRIPLHGLGVAGHYNLDTYERWENAALFSRHHQREGRLDARWRHFIDALVSPEIAQTFMLGAQLERQDHSLDDSRTGGFTYVDRAALDANRMPLATIDETDRSTWELFSSDRGDELHAKIRLESMAAYAADEIRIGTRVVVTPGLRIERQRGSFADGPDSLSSTTLSPRLTTVVDVTGTGAVKLWAQLGRYQRRFDPAMIVRDRAGAAYSALEYWDWTGARDADPPPSSDPGWVRSRQFPAVVGARAANLSTPALDRGAAGLVVNVPDVSLTVGLQYELRAYRHLLGLYDPAFTTYDPVSNPGGTYDQVTTTVAAPTTAGESVGYFQPHGGYRPSYVIGNPNGAVHTAQTARLRVRALLGRFAIATADLSVHTDRANLDDIDGLSLDWRDPSGTLSSKGPLPEQDTVVARLGGTFYLPLGFDLDADYTFRSGAAYSRLIRVFPIGAPRTDVFDARGRGGYRYPNRNIVDLALRRRIPGLSSAWHFTVAARNLMNSATVTGFRQRSTYFQGVTGLEQPFELRIGVTYAP